MVFSVEKCTLVVFLDFVYLGGFFGPKVYLGGFIPYIYFLKKNKSALHNGNRRLRATRKRARTSGDALHVSPAFADRRRSPLRDEDRRRVKTESSVSIPPQPRPHLVPEGPLRRRRGPSLREEVPADLSRSIVSIDREAT